MRALLLLLIATLPALGQRMIVDPFKFSSGPSFFAPTNIAGVISWWCVSSNNYFRTTNGSVVQATLPDLYVNHYDLTNVWPDTALATGEANLGTIQPAALNGFNTLRFDGSHGLLRNLAYAATQPHTVMLMINLTTPVDAATRTIIDNGSGARNLGRISVDKYQINAGSSLTGFTVVTQKWMAVTFVFDGNSSEIWTNMTRMTNGAAGAGNDSGFTLFAGNALTSWMFGDIVEAATYAGHLALIGGISNNVNYWTNRYAVAP
jgi:hypothetical protein